MFDLDELECKFDVVYIDPPLEEYQRRASGTTFSWKPWTWDEVSSANYYPTMCIMYFSWENMRMLYAKCGF